MGWKNNEIISTIVDNDKHLKTWSNQKLWWGGCWTDISLAWQVNMDPPGLEWFLLQWAGTKSTWHKAQLLRNLEGKLRSKAAEQATVDATSLSIVQFLSHVRLFETQWTAARQAYLSFTISQSLLKLICWLSWWCHPTISSSVCWVSTISTVLLPEDFQENHWGRAYLLINLDTSPESSPHQTTWVDGFPHSPHIQGPWGQPEQLATWMHLRARALVQIEIWTRILSFCHKVTQEPWVLFFLDEAKHSQDSFKHPQDQGTPSQTFDRPADKLFHMYKPQPHRQLPLKWNPTCLNKCYRTFLQLQEAYLCCCAKMLLTLTVTTQMKIS